MKSTNVRKIARVLFEPGERFVVAFNKDGRPAAVAPERASITQMGTVPSADFEAPAIFVTEPAKNFLEQPVFAILRSNIPGERGQRLVGDCPHFEIRVHWTTGGRLRPAKSSLTVNMRFRLAGIAFSLCSAKFEILPQTQKTR